MAFNPLGTTEIASSTLSELLDAYDVAKSREREYVGECQRWSNQLEMTREYKLELERFLKKKLTEKLTELTT